MTIFEQYHESSLDMDAAEEAEDAYEVGSMSARSHNASSNIQPQESIMIESTLADLRTQLLALRTGPSHPIAPPHEEEEGTSVVVSLELAPYSYWKTLTRTLPGALGLGSFYDVACQLRGVSVSTTLAQLAEDIKQDTQLLMNIRECLTSYWQRYRHLSNEPYSGAGAADAPVDPVKRENVFEYQGIEVYQYKSPEAYEISSDKVWILMVLAETFGVQPILQSCYLQLHKMLLPSPSANPLSIPSIGCTCCHYAHCVHNAVKQKGESKGGFPTLSLPLRVTHMFSAEDVSCITISLYYYINSFGPCICPRYPGAAPGTSTPVDSTATPATPTKSLLSLPIFATPGSHHTHTEDAVAATPPPTPTRQVPPRPTVLPPAPSHMTDKLTMGDLQVQASVDTPTQPATDPIMEWTNASYHEQQGPIQHSGSKHVDGYHPFNGVRSAPLPLTSSRQAVGRTPASTTHAVPFLYKSTSAVPIRKTVPTTPTNNYAVFLGQQRSKERVRVERAKSSHRADEALAAEMKQRRLKALEVKASMARMLSSSGQVAPQKGFSHESLNSRDIELLPENSYRDEEDTDVAAYRQAKAHRRVMKRRHVEQQLLLQQKRSEAQAEQDSIEMARQRAVARIQHKKIQDAKLQKLAEEKQVAQEKMKFKRRDMMIAQAVSRQDSSIVTALDMSVSENRRLIRPKEPKELPSTYLYPPTIVNGGDEDDDVSYQGASMTSTVSWDTSNSLPPPPPPPLPDISPMESRSMNRWNGSGQQSDVEVNDRKLSKNAGIAYDARGHRILVPPTPEPNIVVDDVEEVSMLIDNLLVSAPSPNNNNNTTNSNTASCMTTLKVLRAVNLPEAFLGGGYTCPYLIIDWGSLGRATTQAIINDTNPLFNSILKFKVPKKFTSLSPCDVEHPEDWLKSFLVITPPMSIYVYGRHDSVSDELLCMCHGEDIANEWNWEQVDRGLGGRGECHWVADVPLRTETSNDAGHVRIQLSIN